MILGDEQCPTGWEQDGYCDPDSFCSSTECDVNYANPLTGEIWANADNVFVRCYELDGHGVRTGNTTCEYVSTYHDYTSCCA